MSYNIAMPNTNKLQIRKKFLSNSQENKKPMVVSPNLSKRARNDTVVNNVVKRQKTTTPAYMRFAYYKEIDSQAREILQNFVHRHLEVREFESPRDILLYLAENKRFRLLPKILRGLAHILEKVEQSYRANLPSGVPLLVQLAQPLLLQQGKSNVLISPSTTNRLVVLHRLCSRTDRSLRAYVSRHQKAKVAAAPPKSVNATPVSSVVTQTSAASAATESSNQKYAAAAATTSTKKSPVSLSHLAASAAKAAAVSAPIVRFPTAVPPLKFYGGAQALPVNQLLRHHMPLAYAQQFIYQAAAAATAPPNPTYQLAATAAATAPPISTYQMAAAEAAAAVDAIRVPVSTAKSGTIEPGHLLENLHQRHQGQYSAAL